MNMNANMNRNAMPRNSNKLIITIVVLVAVGFLLFTAAIIGIVIYAVANGQIADENGADNTALAVLGEEEIVNKLDKYATSMSGEKRSGGRSMITGGSLREYDYDSFLGTYGSISGVKTLLATKTDADTLLVTFESTLESGNMELFIIIDGVIDRRVAANEKTTVSLEGVAGKTVLVKLAGESAECQVTVTREMR